MNMATEHLSEAPARLQGLNTLPKTAYFCMEMAIDQSLYTYSGGLGYLAGSHMLSAGYLKLPLVGVTILWKNGYGFQEIDENEQVKIVYREQSYPFLKDTGIVVDVTIFGETVKVKGLLLEPETFGTAPVYLLTTDIPENNEYHRGLTNVLYDGDQKIRIAQEVILGIGGMRVLKAAGVDVDLVHMNEGHALPAAFEMLSDFGGDLNEVRERLVFTTHTPVAAGNETHPVHLLAEGGFFADTDVHRAVELGGEEFCLTVAALRMSRDANGVSQLHGQVANNMWNWVHGRCHIRAITNAVNTRYWQDPRMVGASNDDELRSAKRQMKQELLDVVREQTGKELNPDVLTVVWARRFTEYKRAGLIFEDKERILKLLEGNKIQLIYAGKFHPDDTSGRDIFNTVIQYAKEMPNLAILTNYDLALSAKLKRGADVWLNTPRRPMEASGTSGMGANMNGAIHCSTFDGWAVEGTYNGLNGFIINESEGEDYLPVEERRKRDYESLMEILESHIIPTYYEDPATWCQLMRHAMQTTTSYFNSDRMVIDYLIQLYKPVNL
ncbi:MAG: alpha-glucan family phosphorylase [Vampirovibrio sp.]|nr:alpha-glucan family phosphorylase [Vampirovibrio sp.]